MNYHDQALQIIDLVGGRKNIVNVTHCFTRLRFVLKDMSKADKKRIEKLEGIISVVEASGQYQIVCGAKVAQYYDELVNILGETVDGGNETMSHHGKDSFVNNIIQKITVMFTPLIPAIAASGLIKGLLTASKLIGIQFFNIDISTSDTYVILFSASQVIFYFMPIFLAMTSAKALKCNQIIAMCLGALFCYPAIDALIQNTSVATTIFGLPVIKGVWAMGEATRVFSYVESVIPILLIVLMMSYLERFLKKYIPSILQIILVPGLEIIMMVPLALVVLGPVGIYVGNIIQFVYEIIMGISPILGGALIGGLWGVLVIFGAHRAILPIGLNDVALTGRQNLLAFAGAANFAQGGASFGVMLKTKNFELKQIAASGSLSAILVGITEPAIYGVNLRLKKPMIYAIIAGSIGGGIMGLGNVYGDAFANNGILTIFTYAAFGMTQFLFYLIGIGIAFFGATAMVYFLGFEDLPSQKSDEEIDDSHLQKNPEKMITLNAPMAGKVIALEDVEDPVFSTKAMGEGVAFEPTVGKLVAPASAIISVIYPTGHAIGLKLDTGVECILHIGINTAELKGNYFNVHVKEGQHVEAGELLISFNLEALKKMGYSLITPMVIVNSHQYKKISIIDNDYATFNLPVLFISKAN